MSEFSWASVVNAVIIVAGVVTLWLKTKEKLQENKDASDERARNLAEAIKENTAKTEKIEQAVVPK